MKAGLFLVTIVIAILGSGELPMAGQIPREPLDSLWEEHMLAGTAATYMSGRRHEVPAEYIRRFEGVRGSWVLATDTIYGIRVNDYRGTRLLGVLRGGGWALRGGMLHRAQDAAGTAELYVKHVAPVYPGLLDNHAPMKEESYEFFLLHRPTDAPRARVLKKWVIRPEDVHLYVPDHVLKGPLGHDKAHLRANETSDVRGFLAYDPATKIATITITGLKHPFEERVDVSAALDN